MAHFRQRQILSYSCVIFLFLLVTLVLRNLTDQLHSESNLTVGDGQSPLSLQSLEWERGGPTNYFWRDDSQCSDYGTRFLVRHSLPPRALVSYPGSGNTWIRYLVEAATGVFTGSIFNDKSILRAGHHGEARDAQDGSTILQKSHHRALYVSRYSQYGLTWRRRHVRQFGGRGVLVIRNPYKAILSYWNFKRTKSHTKTVAAESLHSEDFQEFVRVGAERWLEVIQDWLEFSTDCHVILYEELKENPTAEMRKLLGRLNLRIDEGRLECIEKHSAGSFHRVKHQDESPFTEELHTLLDKTITEANLLLREKTGMKLPLEKYEYFKTVSYD